MRMALILKLLQSKNEDAIEEEKTVVESDVKCSNPHCITTVEQGIKSLAYTDKHGTLRCAYCDNMIK
jgi:aspartate carbamoyltransferase catalytic subunit